MGVLIHIHPDDLLANIQKVINSSNRYIVVGEYFNRTPVELEYKVQEINCSSVIFGKFILENLQRRQLRLIDYGFLWEYRIYDKGGFDDITWWVLKNDFIC